VLFVPADEDGELDAIFAKTAGKPVLTIGEDEAFIQSGCIRFFEDQNKIRFEVNLDAISGASLKISAKLEKLAKIFHK
jgi:predicted ATPase